MKAKVLVTGSKGQLGLSLEKMAVEYPDLEFIYTDVDQLDITKLSDVQDFFDLHNPDFCINAAAYTQVDKAEEQVELNNLINITGPKNLAIACKTHGATLIHISSEYVYNNDSARIMTESSPTTPKGQYAISKLKGEQEVINAINDYYIIRTSWLYSEFGNNFVKTMLRLGRERKSVNVVNDQIGSPTYATDLADAILKIIIINSSKFGIYNFSNCGFISWYDFTKEIFLQKEINCQVNPIPTTEFPTKAPRPLNSKISKEKIKLNFGLKIVPWRDSLAKCLRKI